MQPPDFGKELKRSGELLWESEERFRLMVEGVKDYAIFMLDVEGYVTTWNLGAQRLKGYDAEEIIGEHFSIFYTDEDVERRHPEEELRVAVAEGRYEEEGIRIRKDGSTFWANVLITALRDEEGNLRGFAKVTRDITARKEAEEKLRESEEHYRLVARATNEAIWDSDLLADKQTWDGAFETMFGYPLQEETNGAWWEEHVHPEDRERVLSGIDEILQGTGETWSDEYRFRRADGTYATVVDRGYVVRDAEGEPVRVIGSMMDVTERRRAEEALRTSEAELRALIAAMTDVILVLDIEGRYLKVAPTNLSLLYKPSDELVGKTLHEVMPGKQADEFLEHIRRALETQRPVDTEYSLQIAGEEVWFAGTVSPMQEDSVVYVARDITVRKRAEEEIRRLNEELDERVEERTARLEAALAELRSSEERYRLLVESAEDYAIFMVDREGRVADWNVGAERIFGYREEEIVGKPGSILFTPEDRWQGAHEEELRKAVAEGRAEDERWHIRKDGTRFWASGVVTPARDEAGNVRGFAKVARDDTERKEAEKKLREAETRYRTLVEQTPAITYVQEPVESSRPKAVTYMSPQYETILGYPSESEAIDEQHWLRILHPEDKERVLAEEVRTDETGEPFEVEYRVIAADDRIVWLRDQATLVRDEEGKPRYWLGIQYDITERKRAEEALKEIREAERRRIARDLHDGVLQDLSYTTAAMGLIMLKAAGTSLEEELQKTIDALRRAAQGLRNAVNDLRLEEEQDRPFPELVESLVQRNRMMARGCRIGLEVEEGFPATSFRNAGTEILRVIQEALTNARRHSGARNVRVTLRSEGDEIVAEISDDGRGFDPGTAPGVGFRSMRERAAALGGKLQIESEVGEGTRMRLRVSIPQGE